MKKIKLTSLSHGSGCGCKMTRKDLAIVLDRLPKIADPNVIIGTATADDAAVYKIDDKRAIVQTVDFFTPIVDDPYAYGQISAANSISDVYAMGGRPLFALSIIAFPINTIPASVLEEIVKGGVDKAKEAGIDIIGGHSIDDPEPKYGLTVTGVVELDKVVRNDMARPGDVLILTKPLGAGIISKAIKENKASEDDIKEVIKVMSFLNKGASEAMTEAGIRAATDVTGFGLLGHLYGMLKASGVGARLKASSIPTIDGVWRYAKKGYIPAGTKNNLAYVAEKIIWENPVSNDVKYVIADAQTSGGLLISCPKDKKERLTALLSSADCLAVSEIGELVDDIENRIWISQ